ncbi:hypothetical protein HPB50_017485 [Hyalomma asiaticum]|uniref:Uncharacterized protein n=1 Tax=Hyalomma asiaticum TaxID=266040 RepID=A0ACB7S157_HYAAI|nr:hypothetical protein HPB50_017485 [Hyalomma asiaticum]
MGRRWPLQQEAASETGVAFCCPDDMRETLRYVNTSANPCRDFFAYVCAGVVKYRLWPESSNHAEFERTVFTGVMPPGAPKSPAGEFLVAFHRSCLESVARQNIATAFSGALVRKEQGVLKNMDPKKAFIYATTATVKYRLKTAFYVVQQASEKNVAVGAALLCSYDDSYIRDALTASVDAINSVLHLAVTEQRTHDLKVNICSIHDLNPEENVTYTAANRSDFHRDVWNIGDLDAGLSANGLSLATVQFLTVNQPRTVRAILEIFARERNGSSTGAALLVWHSLVSGVTALKAPKGGSPQRVFNICNREVNSLWQMGLIFKVNLFTSPDKDAQLRVIFNNVKDAVRVDLLKSGFVEAADVARLERFFRDLTLFTPAEMAATAVSLPQLSRDFASLFLESHVFEFEASKAFFSRVDGNYSRAFAYLRVGGNRSVYVSSNLYHYIQTGEAKWELSNMATVGRILAETLWFMVFRTATWSSGTRTNMSRFEECYESFYWSNGTAKNPDAITSFFTALGLSSVLNAFNRPHWLAVKSAWGFWRMSHSQLFYILSTYARCPKTSTDSDVNLVNAPLRYITDFADAFQCRPSAPMTKRDHCAKACARREVPSSPSTQDRWSWSSWRTGRASPVAEPACSFTTGASDAGSLSSGRTPERSCYCAGRAFYTVLYRARHQPVSVKQKRSSGPPCIGQTSRASRHEDTPSAGTPYEPPSSTPQAAADSPLRLIM